MKLQLRTDAQAATGAALASRDIPDAAVARLQAIYLGTTNAETAANVLRAIWKDMLRQQLKGNAANTARNTAMVSVQAAVDAAVVLFESEIPEGAP